MTVTVMESSECCCGNRDAAVTVEMLRLSPWRHSDGNESERMSWTTRSVVIDSNNSEPAP